MLLEKWLADISEWLPESSRLTKPGLGKVINSCQRANKQESSPLGYLVPSPPEPPLEMVPVSQFKKNQPRLPQGFVPNPKGYFDSPPQKSYGTSRKRTRRHRRKGKKNKTKARKVKRTV